MMSSSSPAPYDCLKFEIVADADPTSSKVIVFTPSFTANCNDLNQRCDYWARIRECGRNFGYQCDSFARKAASSAMLKVSDPFSKNNERRRIVSQEKTTTTTKK